MEPLFAGIVSKSFNIPEGHPFSFAIRFLIVGQIICVLICMIIGIIEIVANLYKIPWIKEMRNLLLMTRATKQVADETHEKIAKTSDKVEAKVEKIEQKIDQMPQVLIEAKIEAKSDGKESK
jgi:hypothetical protein